MHFFIDINSYIINLAAMKLAIENKTPKAITSSDVLASIWVMSAKVSKVTLFIILIFRIAIGNDNNTIKQSGCKRFKNIKSNVNRYAAIIKTA